MNRRNEGCDASIQGDVTESADKHLTTSTEMVNAPLGEITWVGFAMGNDHLHVFGDTQINCPGGRKTLKRVSR